MFSPQSLVPRPSSRTQSLRDVSKLLPGPVQIFWYNLKELQDWWLLLLPFLAWVGWRTYRKERSKVLQERFAAQQHKPIRR